MELLPFIQNVFSSTKSGLEGLSTIFDTLNVRLSASRAAKIDYLTNISQGTVVPQAYVGDATNAPNLATVVTNVDVFKAIDKIYQMMETHAGTPTAAPSTFVPISGTILDAAFIYGVVPPGRAGLTPPQLRADQCSFMYQQGRGRFDHAAIQIGLSPGGSEILAYTLPAVTLNTPVNAQGATEALLFQYEIPMTGQNIYVRLQSFTSTNTLLGYYDYTYTTVGGDVPSIIPAAHIGAVVADGSYNTSPLSALPGTTQVVRWPSIANAVGYALDVTAYGRTTRYGGSSSLATSATITIPTGGGAGSLITIGLTVFLADRLHNSGQVYSTIPSTAQYLTVS